jgi:hypothetical protein
MKDVLQTLFELTFSLRCLTILQRNHNGGPMVKNLVFRATILIGVISSALAADLDTARIDELTGLEGKMMIRKTFIKLLSRVMT